MQTNYLHHALHTCVWYCLIKEWLFVGFVAVAFTYPLDVVRTRLAFQVTGEHVYLGIRHAFHTIFHKEGGVKALYRGIVPTILGMAPYAGLCNDRFTLEVNWIEFDIYKSYSLT